MAGKPLVEMSRCPKCGEKSVLYRTTREEWENGQKGADACIRESCDYEDYSAPDPSPKLTEAHRHVAGG